MREIPLSRGLVAIVDDEDYSLVTGVGSWHAAITSHTHYARRLLPRVPDAPRPHQYMHSLITGWPYVDHVNGLGYDNRRANLRPAASSQNNANRRQHRNNTSGFKGVSWHIRQNRWRSQIQANGKIRYLGSFSTAEEAARAYDAAARDHFGPFACVNFPLPGEAGVRGLA